MGSSSLLFLSTQFDKFLNQEFKKEQMEALPLSIKGFRLVPEEGVEPHIRRILDPKSSGLPIPPPGHFVIKFNVS